LSATGAVAADVVVAATAAAASVVVDFVLSALQAAVTVATASSTTRPGVLTMRRYCFALSHAYHTGTHKQLMFIVQKRKSALNKPKLMYVLGSF